MYSANTSACTRGQEKIERINIETVSIAQFWWPRIYKRKTTGLEIFNHNHEHNILSKEEQGGKERERKDYTYCDGWIGS